MNLPTTTAGEAYQFDWSHETITLAGLPLTVKAAHMKLSHSRMPFVRVYFRETQELVFDPHDKAFRFYGGVCRRGMYDNMKTAVEAIFVGKARRYNLRFLQMCSHHLIEPVACTPASGWEKGQVVADHPRHFRRDQIIYDPWHYLPVLMKKPGALRNGAPFKDWALPPALPQVRAKLKQYADGQGVRRGARSRPGRGRGRLCESAGGRHR
jgi:hypothetical protein